MRESLIRVIVMLSASLLWLAGLRLFLRSDLSGRRKLVWSAFLLSVGIGIGFALPLVQVWSKFLWLFVSLPVLGAIDVLVLRSGHGLAFWIRACGFEVCSVFATAGITRYLLDYAGVTALIA
jgi:hypothetical protein